MPTAVSGILQQAQTDYTNALAALKAGNLAQLQTDIRPMQQQITQAQQLLGTAHRRPRRPRRAAKSTRRPRRVDHHHVAEGGEDPSRRLRRPRARPSVPTTRSPRRRHDDVDTDRLGGGGPTGIQRGRAGRGDPGACGGRSRLRAGPGGPMMSRPSERKASDGTARQGEGAAATATEAAKDAAAKGQAKLDEAQAKRRPTPCCETSVPPTTPPRRAGHADHRRGHRTLVAALQAHEAEHGPITLAPESAAAAPTAAAGRDRAPPATAPGGRSCLPTASAPHGPDALGSRRADCWGSHRRSP